MNIDEVHGGGVATLFRRRRANPTCSSPCRVREVTVRDVTTPGCQHRHRWSHSRRDAVARAVAVPRPEWHRGCRQGSCHRGLTRQGSANHSAGGRASEGDSRDRVVEHCGTDRENSRAGRVLSASRSSTCDKVSSWSTRGSDRCPSDKALSNPATTDTQIFSHTWAHSHLMMTLMMTRPIL